MIVDINGRKHRLGITHLIYFLILLLFTFYILADLQYNTAFVDEAIYATVGEEVLRGIFWESALSWMGGSYLYPVVSGLINRIYGLAGIRVFSFLCLFTAGVIAGELARAWGGRTARVIAVFLFFSSSAVFAVSSLGTYDAPAILFLSCSVLCSFFSREKEGHARFSLIIASSLFFFAGFLAKYVSILFIPFVPLFILREKDYVLSPLVLWLTPFSLGVVLYLLFALNPLLDFFTGDSFTEVKSRIEIAEDMFNQLNIFLITLTALPILLVVKSKYARDFAILFLAGVAPLVYHLLSSNYRSLGKHLVFTQFFWIPILAVFLAYILQKFKKIIKNKEEFVNLSLLIYTTAIAAVIFIAWTNMSQHWRFKRSWPSASAPLAYLARVRTPSDRIFAEGSAVYKYHLFDGFENPLSWTSTWYIEYEGETGLPAMEKAIREEAFDYIILNGYYTAGVSNELAELANIHYEKVLTDTYKVSGEYDIPTFLWARKAVGNVGIENEN